MYILLVANKQKAPKHKASGTAIKFQCQIKTIKIEP